MVKGQEKLQQQVAQVDGKVSVAQKEIEGVRTVALTIQDDTSDIRRRAIALEEEVKAAQDQLKRQAVHLARIESTMARKGDLAAVQLDVSKMNGNLENLAKIVVTKGDIPEIKRMVEEAFDDRIDRARAEYTKQLSAASDDESSKRTALPAPRQMVKQTT